ncbi:MAG: aminotransferase class I/II-fold pyridoxal phosphate-dependent enzyme [Planctomycetaceae bacterium]|nr:aminotransferase class I/II-fold pyridoxal phosphate-dependent enzyme [Planctomycetaceae bacterium]
MDRISDVYSADTFAKLSQVWQATISEHMSRVLAGDGKVLNWIDPSTAVAKAESFLTANESPAPDTLESRSRKFGSLLQTMLAHGQNLHHPHYIGHQVPASAPAAGLFDAVGSVTNQPMAIFEMGPWGTAVEIALIRALCCKVGWNADASTGVLTHGGSLANLTALLTARNIAFRDSWKTGVPSGAVLIAHSDAHYCIARSAGILGLGTQQVVRAELDHRRRMDPDRLEHTIREQRRRGKSIMAVVACSCATPIGAFDPLPQIADVCERNNVWLHVDAAHGGATLMSRRHRHLMSGCDRADSIVWDAHKMLFVPALCAAVLYRDKASSFQTFQQDAPYLFDPSRPGDAEFDSGTRTFECTKRSTGFGLWGLWSLYGEQLFEDLVDRTFHLAELLHARLTASDDFEPLHTPEANIVVFRHLPDRLRTASPEAQNLYQKQLRAAIIQSGRFYVVQTTIDGVTALRTTVMNPLTTENDLSELLETIRELGSGIVPAIEQH